MAELSSWQSIAPLIGRDVELALLRDRLADPWVRLVTLVGCPGVGKSALAFHAALAVYELFHGAVVVADPASLDLAVPAERVRSALIILDGADVAATSAMVGKLLAAQPGTKLLVTRRAPLRVRAEVVVPVPSLEVPDAWPDSIALDLAGLARIPAVALFLARARAVSPAFALTEQNAPAVAALCRVLDGLPLAIELAAPWVDLLPVETLLERLTGGPDGSTLDLLSGGYHDSAHGHASLRDALASAYDALTPEEQALLRQLAALDGEFSLADVAVAWQLAAEALGAERAHTGALRTLRVLVSQGLISRTFRAHPPRFRVLQLVRAFVSEQEMPSGAVLELADSRRHVWRLPAGPAPKLLAPPAPSHAMDGGESALACLSSRERDVLRLVAHGQSNREVAQNLALSERTVAHHLTSIYNKLGVSSRTAAASLALRSGLA